MSALALFCLGACAAGGGGQAQDQTPAQRAAQVTAPIGLPPELAPQPGDSDAPAGSALPAEQPGDITVPSPLEEPTPQPPGDPRTTEQRMRDIRAWDRCVSRAQAQQSEARPGQAIMDSPEEICSQSLGMRDRTSVPYR